MAHTPGPWQVMPPERAIHDWVIADQEGGSLAECSPAGPWVARAEADANAALIAAAPDLLAALKLLVADVADYEAWQRPCHALDVARAAIAKAEAA